MIVKPKHILTRNEYSVLVDFLLKKYNVNLHKFSYSIAKRRIEDFFVSYDIYNHLEMIEFLKKDNFFRMLWKSLQVPTTELFRDYEVWQKIQKKIFRKLPNPYMFSIWLPSVTSDDELFSILILLNESNLLDRVSVYVSSEIKDVKSEIERNIISMNKYKMSKQNYTSFIKNGDFDRHFKISEDSIFLRREYLRKIKYLDFKFYENSTLNIDFDMVIYRNRMLYYNPQMKISNLDKIYNTLKVKGYLIIGLKETLQNWTMQNKFTSVDKEIGVYQKKK